ncbi:MAG TPA: hypothetical protein VL625_11875 [Patescibacteria group bacterium]|jgi:hypothetical protein|nr:hypothetical protein [Patescibacteria group bacterium]
MDIFQRLFKPQRITAAANEYHLSAEFSRRAGKPVLVERVYAQKDFFGDTWSLYKVTDHPMRPVAHIAAPGGMLGLRGAPYYVIDNRWGIPEKIAGKLSLREAFDRVRAHEENAPARSLKRGQEHDELLDRYGVSPDGSLFLAQKKPADDPGYWRNMTPPPI